MIFILEKFFKDFILKFILRYLKRVSGGVLIAKGKR